MIKNIIFDFGNVLLNIDESASYNAIANLLDPVKSKDIYEMIFHPFEKGEISEDSFFNRLQRRSKIVYNVDVYYKAWNAMFLDLPVVREQMLLELKKKYRVFLLSNTNITHMRFVKRMLERDNGIVDFDHQFFEKAYYSYEIGMRKPDHEIYQFVLNDSSMSANETLFIDDKIENVEAAKELGIRSYHHDPNDEISKIIYSQLT